MNKHRLKYITIFITLIFTPLISLAEAAVQKISIQEAVNIASKNNLDIQSSRLNLKIEENNIKTANRLKNPGIGIFYNLGKSGKGNPQQIGLIQTVEIGKRKARKDFAKSYYDLAERNIEYLETDLRMDVREAYTNLLAKKSVLSTLTEQENLLYKLSDSAKNLYKTGKVEEIDILQSQLLLNQIRTQVNSAKYDVKTALYEFNKVINSPQGFYDTIEEDFSKEYKPFLMPEADAQMPDFETISYNAVKDRTDIKIALQEIDNAKKNLIVVLRQKIPDFEIQGGYGYQNPGQSENGTFKHGAYVGVNLVNIPILYSFTPEINNAKIKLVQAELNYASVENKALNDIKKAYEKFITAQINLKYYNDELLLSSEDLIKVSRKKYKEGKIDITTLISMEESYRMIIIAHTYALAEYYNAWNLFIREVNNENFKIDTINEDV